MDRELLNRFNTPELVAVNNVSLTQFPLGNSINPGIGVQVYDFLLPLRGKEYFETKKPIISEELQAGNEKNQPSEKTFMINSFQQGFGNSKSASKTLNSAKKNFKLGEVYNAMTKAKIDVDEIKFKPITDKKKPKKLSPNHKFKVE